MRNTFSSYFMQDLKQVLLKVEQALSTWLVSFSDSVILFLLVTETLSGTVQQLQFSLSSQEELIYDTSREVWLDCSDESSLYCLQVKLYTTLQTVKKQRGINRVSLYQVSKLYIACYIQEYGNWIVTVRRIVRNKSVNQACHRKVLKRILKIW